MARREDGKRYDHQRRLRSSVLREVRDRLARAPIASCTSFEQLHTLLDKTVGSVVGVGRLMLYDTALRIGAKLGLQPLNVYLHRGTQDGARALGLHWHADYLEIGDLPCELRELEPREIEDCLCIFKDDLAQLRVR